MRLADSLILALAWVSCCPMAAAEPDPAPVELTTDTAVPVEAFAAPRSKKLYKPAYPMSEALKLREGWVWLNFMVDTTGNAYAIDVADSAGPDAFEKAAIGAIEKSTFEPARMGNTAIDAGHSLVLRFDMDRRGAERSFVNAYKSLLEAIRQRNQSQAQSILATMNVVSLYEDAYLNFGQHLYYHVWGTKEQQLSALRRAIAHNSSQNYLPDDLNRAATLAAFGIEVELRDYGSALERWEWLEKQELDDPTRGALRRAVDEIEKLRSDERQYSVSGELDERGSWGLTLLKPRFHIDVKSGQVAELKLRCPGKYVLFRFDPKIEYTVNGVHGACHLQVVGAAGTAITLWQG